MDADPRCAHRCAVLGKPIAHSLSPVLHTAAYRALGLDDWSYRGIEVGQEDLEPFLDALDDSWRGLSLTMPLKRTVLPMGEPCDSWTRELEVANTALLDRTPEGRRRIRLFNTDVYGVARAFDHARTTHGAAAVQGGEAVILGNGNTAASALAACVMMGDVRHVTIAARHPDGNPRLVSLGARHGLRVDLVALDEATRALAEADLAVNTIPAHGADVVAERLAREGRATHGTLLDVVYDPRPTALMSVWRDLGGVVIGGQEMLLYQAVAQVLLMTGRAERGAFDRRGVRTRHTALEESMRTALEEAL